VVTDITTYRAELAAAFALRCCACGRSAIAVCIGSDTVPDRNLCERCWLETLPVGGKNANN
jgi:hypothetical protein